MTTYDFVSEFPPSSSLMVDLPANCQKGERMQISLQKIYDATLTVNIMFSCQMNFLIDAWRNNQEKKETRKKMCCKNV